jgi:surfactin synthase thioesterase subunit
MNPQADAMPRPAGSPWLATRRTLDHPRIRLYCLPHSGGSPGEYMRLGDELTDVEVTGIKLPGRGARVAERPIDSMPTLVSAMLAAIEFRPPYALFGHSFGALAAYELTHALLAGDRPLPEMLLVSGYGAPHLPREVPPLSGLPDQELLRELDQRFDGTQAGILRDPALAALVLPALRADLAALESYRYHERPPLPRPLAVLGGARDVLTRAQLTGWTQHTSRSCTLRLLPGGHFYFREHPGLAGELAAALRVPAAQQDRDGHVRS